MTVAVQASMSVREANVPMHPLHVRALIRVRAAHAVRLMKEEAASGVIPVPPVRMCVHPHAARPHTTEEALPVPPAIIRMTQPGGPVHRPAHVRTHLPVLLLHRAILLREAAAAVHVRAAADHLHAVAAVAAVHHVAVVAEDNKKMV